MTVNFTMQVRNRPRLTMQALNSLLAAVGDHDDMNVTILDDRSDEETTELLKQWIQIWPAHTHYIRNEIPMGTGPLRNLVIAEAENFWGRGDYLYLSDNDVFFHPGWLGRLIQAYEKAWTDGYRVVGAYNHPYHQPVSTFPVTKGSYVLCNVNQVNALATQSMLMRWEVWDKYGPFCQTPVDKVCQSEDVDFTNKIVADGFKLGVVSPALVVSTGITNTFGEKIPGWELVKAQAPEGVIVE